MTYYPAMAYRMVSLAPPLAPTTGLGDLPATTWCSSSNKQGACSPIAGVCLPMDSPTLEVYKNLQRQVNRLLVKAGKKALDVDGRIGPSTVTAVADAISAGNAITSILGDLFGVGGGGVIAGVTVTRSSSCDVVAAHADAIATALAGLAGAAGAPAVADPGTSKPSVASPTGQVVHPPANQIVQSAMTGGVFNWVPAEIRTPLGLAAFAVGGFAIYKAVKGPKGVRRGRTRARARRRH